MGPEKPKVMTVYGTRPEAIKLAPVISLLANDDRFDLVAVSTGQHREMLNQVNAKFGIELSYDLALMKPNQSLNELVSRVLTGLEDVLNAEKPDLMIIQGDTSTAMAAALAGFHRKVDIVHVEAGLRTGDLKSPFPEEVNRRMVAQFASLHLAPTIEAKNNLKMEGISEEKICVTGNTVIDALLTAAQWETTFSDEMLARAIENYEKSILVTAHRRENLHNMKRIGRAVKTLAEQNNEVLFVLPLHLNPLVREPVLTEVRGLSNIVITEPMPYDEFAKLMAMSTLILTDSGGIQEEAPSLDAPVLLMRDNTERPEAIEVGSVKLVGTDHQTIVESVNNLLNDSQAFRRMSKANNPYGDGSAAFRSVQAISYLLGFDEKPADFA